MGNVLLVMGHRNTSGGDAREAQRTPLVVAAAARALRNAGHTVHILQEEDGDGNPQDTNADLAFVGRQCAQLIKQHRIDVMIDCHFQGSPNPQSGCFCIFPDGNQLSPTPPVDDSKMANQRAVAFADRLAAAVSLETGIPRLNLGEPGFLGGMSERQTFVGSQGNRLGMFWLTVPPPQCVRVVMEHGDIVADGGTIDSPGFYDRVARAYVRAIDAFWPVVTATPEYFAFPAAQRFTAQAGAIGRNHASTDSDIVRRYTAGEAIDCVGYYESQSVDNDNRWLRATGEDAPRIHRSGVVEEIPNGTQTMSPPEMAAAEATAIGAPPSEAALAQAEAARRGPEAASAQVVDPMTIGCDMITAPVGITEAAAITDIVSEAAMADGADVPVGHPGQPEAADQDRSDYVGLKEHGRVPHNGAMPEAAGLLTSAVWGGRPVQIFTENGQPATWDPCQSGGVCETGCGDGCCWYDFSTSVCLDFCTHPGMDIGVTKHTALYAAKGGTVEFAGRDNVYYRPHHVDIRTPDGQLHIYAHMWSVDGDVVRGGQVREGQFLGTSGEQTWAGTMTPDGSGPHLHFELRSNNGCAVDPTAMLANANTILHCAPSAPPAFNGTMQTIGNTDFHPDRRTVEVAFDGLGCRRWGNLAACTTRKPLAKGDKVEVLYWVEGEQVGNENRWWVATDGTRIHAGGTVEKPQG